MSTQNREQRRAAARAEREAGEREAATAERRRTRLLQLGGVVVAAAAVVAVVVIAAGTASDDETTAAVPTSSAAVTGQAEIAEQLSGIPQDGIALGDPYAPISIVEFGDLQCPACAAWASSELTRLVEQYIRPGTARMEFRTLTFLGEDSKRLGTMAQAAGQQDRLFQFIELVYANQGVENSGYATDEYLRTIAGAIDGFDVDRALAARDSDAVAQQLANASRLASINGVQATPSFLVGRTGGEMKLVDAASLGVELERLADLATPDAPRDRPPT